jgi:lipopolysaccharide transport system ATP-binding protein
MSDIAIRVDGLAKRYRIGQRESYKTLRDSLTDLIHAPLRRLSLLARPNSSSNEQPQVDDGHIWALRDVSFEVKRGEVLGVIGRNGAGKSTLLKILSRITEPTEGCAEIHGRVGSLLEVGTGFHPELTGRENIYLNGAILGMKRAEIDGKFDEIVAFAEIEKFIDTPVKRYSSGMYVRLAFAVAAHLNPEILVVDEVLAVGDAAFQEKCLGRMSMVSSEGRTVLFVSHNMDAITRLCGRAIWLDTGKVTDDGSPDWIVGKYLAQARDRHLAGSEGVSLVHHPGRFKPFDGVVRLTNCRVIGISDNGLGQLITGGDCRIILGYEADFPLTGNRANFVIVFRNESSVRLASCWSEVTWTGEGDLGTKGEVECHIRRIPLLPGRYVLDMGCKVASGWSDFIYEAATLDVTTGGSHPSGQLPLEGWGPCLMEYAWSKSK